MASLLSRPWMEDSASPWCLLCRTAFTFTTRRHHCRECGDLVCSACSSRSLVLEKADDRTPQRVCDNCFARLVSASAQQVFTSEAEGAASTVLFELRVVGARELEADRGARDRAGGGRARARRKKSAFAIVTFSDGRAVGQTVTRYDSNEPVWDTSFAIRVADTCSPAACFATIELRDKLEVWHERAEELRRL